MFYVHYIHLQSWPVLCTTYKYMIKQMHRGYLQEPNNSLYTSKNENIKKKKKGKPPASHADGAHTDHGGTCRGSHVQGLAAGLQRRDHGNELLGTSTASPQFRAVTAPGHGLSPAHQRRSVAT